MMMGDKRTLRIRILIDLPRHKLMYGIEEQIKGKWYAWCANAREIIFSLRYDACFFLEMMREIIGPAKSKKSKKRKMRRGKR